MKLDGVGELSPEKAALLKVRVEGTQLSFEDKKILSALLDFAINHRKKDVISEEQLARKREFEEKEKRSKQAQEAEQAEFLRQFYLAPTTNEPAAGLCPTEERRVSTTPQEAGSASWGCRIS